MAKKAVETEVKRGRKPSPNSLRSRLVKYLKNPSFRKNGCSLEKMNSHFNAESIGEKAAIRGILNREVGSTFIRVPNVRGFYKVNDKAA